jgi:dephospho-CoA kinase
MRRWVVTGPAGSGKSELCRMLAARGAAILDGDTLGHEVLATAEVTASVAATFGPGVISGGRVDRKALGSMVFGDPVALKKLNGLTHGPLSEMITSLLGELEQAERYRLAVLEAAVYFLLPPVPKVELVITLTGDPEIRLGRLIQAGLDSRSAAARIAAQEYMEAGWTNADLVLANDGPLSDLEAVAEALWERLDD